ncbi:hypothetical protein PoB_007217500 [Plakobranchus ocellatus]|uniref:G-protein coupled receptors family 1 profile domain-containing protein n=1 Tax=Plakobranchus ocellatus TaxID=259542 RepID=A0AAV4DNF7_9GAST|nr:hypothetical protein PoB_007217500 [Plakobranchus ocellatus]
MSDFDLIVKNIKPWPFQWLSCVALGALSVTFSLLAVITALLIGRPMARSRSRSRYPHALSGRDSLAMALLGGHPANLALGFIAIWFATEDLPHFLSSRTCTDLVMLAVVCQWNVVLSTPVLTFYYALLLINYDSAAVSANQEDGHTSRAGHRQRASRQRRELQLQAGTGRNERNSENESRQMQTRGSSPWLTCHSKLKSEMGVVMMLGVVNFLTLIGTFASLSELLKAGEEENYQHTKRSNRSFCLRFLLCAGNV